MCSLQYPVLIQNKEKLSNTSGYCDNLGQNIEFRPKLVLDTFRHLVSHTVNVTYNKKYLKNFVLQYNINNKLDRIVLLGEYKYEKLLKIISFFE